MAELTVGLTVALTVGLTVGLAVELKTAEGGTDSCWVATCSFDKATQCKPSIVVLLQQGLHGWHEGTQQTEQ